MSTHFFKKPLVIASSLLLLCVSGLVNAESTQKGKITLYTTGWNVNSIRVQTTAPFVGTPCASIADGYITSPSDPGNAAHQAALLMAYETNKSVSFALDGCYAGRPKIIGVYVTNN